MTDSVGHFFPFAFIHVVSRIHETTPHLDHLLSQWVFDPNTLNSRMVKGRDGRDIIQMRVDMGVLQMETTGRPDGAQPNGCETYLDYLQTLLLKDPEHKLNESECGEVDREFMQFYHRRICWLRLQYYSRAVMDADHTLRLMDISDKMSPDEEWTGSHEQYRPFVLFHRTQADSLAKLDDSGPEQAVEAINAGLEMIHEFFVRHDAEEILTKTSWWFASLNCAKTCDRSTRLAKRFANVWTKRCSRKIIY